MNNDYINLILKDISEKLNIKITENDIVYYTDGASNSIVFNIFGKYLIKTVDDITLKSQNEFLKIYSNISNFQKIIFINEKLKYICFEYIEGTLFKNVQNINNKELIKQIYQIVKAYKIYPSKYCGYLFEDKKTWIEFLEDEILNSSKNIIGFDIPMDKINSSIEILKEFNITQRLIHGDFGAHNFLIDNSMKLRVIDPMPVIGDYLYDFYFAIFSNLAIFKDLKISYILSFFKDESILKKKALLTIVLFIRMGRCFKYNKEDFNYYYNLYLSIK